MILDGSKGWYRYLKSLPEKVREYDVPVRFSIVEREIGDRLSHNNIMLDEDVVAFNIEDADTLLGILFDESLKFRCIAAIDESMVYTGYDEVIYVTIVLVQGKDHTNIDADVLDSFAKAFKK